MSLLHKVATPISFLLVSFLLKVALCAEEEFTLPEIFFDIKEKTNVLIKSVHTSHNDKPAEKDQAFQVEDIFSPRIGGSYTRFVSKSNSFAIVSDSPRGRVYYVKDASSGDEFTCELDHKHQHKHSFPWMFEFESNSTYKGKLPIKRFIYGTGAILMHATKRELKSTLIGDKSPHPKLNVWIMEENNIEVKLFFEKPSSRTRQDGTRLREAIRNSRLVSIEVEHKKPVAIAKSNLIETIEIESLVSGIEKQANFWPRDGNSKYDYYWKQLAHCRAHTAKQRPFPSLLKALGQSATRSFVIETVSHKYNEAKVSKPGAFDKSRGRMAWDSEFQTEFLSLHEGARLITYAPAGEDATDGQTEYFLERFFDRKDADLSIFYRIVTRNSKLTMCRINVWEDGDMDPVLVRPFYLNAPGDSTPRRRYLLGLTALLINAAHLEERQYSRHPKVVEHEPYPEKENSKLRLEVDEWKVFDKKNSHEYRLYFQRAVEQYVMHDIKDLLRIDVLNINPNQDDERNMLIRYDISVMNFGDIDIAPYVEVPKGCPKGPLTEEVPKYHDEPFLDQDDDIGGVDNDEQDNTPIQDDFGLQTEGHTFPDFYEFLDGELSYKISSRVRMKSKEFYLQETTELATDLTRLDVFYSDLAKQESRPDLSYFINYQTESLFLIRPKGECEYLDRVPKVWWLRLLAAPLEYHIDQGDSEGHINLVQSDRLPSLGLGGLWRWASSSDGAEFVGSSAERGEAVWMATEADGVTGLDLPIHFAFRYGFRQAQELKRLGKTYRLVSLLDLKSVTIRPEQLPESSHFSPVEFDSISMDTESLRKLELPAECRVLASSHKPQFIGFNEKIPNFFEFIHKTDSYCAKYYLKQSKPGDPDLSNAQVIIVHECYDRAKGQGRIESKTRDGVSKTILLDQQKIYLYDSGNERCKAVANLEVLFTLKKEPANSASQAVNPNRLFGLANLWIQLSEMRGATLSIRHKFNKFGLKTEIHIYSSAYELLDDERLVVRAEFEHQPIIGRTDDQETAQASSHVRQGHRYVLKQVHIRPFNRELDEGPGKVPITYISVIEMNPKSDYEFKLPAACVGQNEELTPGQANAFPRLESVWGITEPQFHMRSESILSLMGGVTKSMRLLDEWLLGDKLRVQSRSTKYDLIDLLLLGDTGELFDVTNPIDCQTITSETNLPGVQDASLPTTRSEFTKFWSIGADRSATLTNPLSLFVGGLTLWRLAGHHSADAKLISSASIGSHELTKDSLDRDMRQESWQVASRPNSKASWSMELDFERRHAGSFEEPDEGIKLPPVLRQVRLRSQGLISGVTVELEISIINYAYQLSEEQKVKMFLVPEGGNCHRSESALKKLQLLDYKFDYKPDEMRSLFYEASLEMSRGPPSGSKIFPLHSGFLDIGTSEKFVDLSGSYAQLDHTRFPDAHFEATRTIYDRKTGLQFEIDTLTGFCKISQRPSEPSTSWSIKFSGLPGEPKSFVDIKMTSQLFALLFTDKTDFKPVNNYNLDNQHVTTYERRLDSLKLAANLQMPVSIVRKFVDPQFEVGSGASQRRVTRLYNHVQVRLIMFDEKLKFKVAELNIELSQSEKMSFDEFVGSFNVIECYDPARKAAKNFKLEYQLEGETLELAKARLFVLEQSMLKLLIPTQQIRPFQIEHASSRIQLTGDGIMRFHFRLLDSPPPELYFKRKADSQLSLEAQARASFRSAALLEECADFCDSVGCSIMSHCPDRLCAVATSEQIATLDRSPSELYEMALGCTYFYRDTGVQIPSLASLTANLDRIINVERQSNQFKMLFFADVPPKFYQLDSTLGESHENPDSIDFHLERSQFMKLSSEQQLVAEATRFTGLKVKLNTESSYSACLSTCAREGCRVISYCQPGSCTIYSGAPEIHIKHLLAHSIQAKGCSISVPNFLASYKRFSDTLVPDSSLQRLDDYSAIECASACDGTSKPSCLSFDFCKAQQPNNQNTYCFLQSNHIMLDSFDRSILVSNWDQSETSDYRLKIDETIVTCEHFSRSILSDYRLLTAKKLTHISDARLVGMNEEQCAINCQQDEQCLAFQFCSDTSRTDSQSCSLLTPNLLAIDCSINLTFESLWKTIELMAEPNPSCRIYIQARPKEELLVSNSTGLIHVKLSDNIRSKVANLLPFSPGLIILSFVALITGLVAQILINKFNLSTLMGSR